MDDEQTFTVARAIEEMLLLLDASLSFKKIDKLLTSLPDLLIAHTFTTMNKKALKLKGMCKRVFSKIISSISLKTPLTADQVDGQSSSHVAESILDGLSTADEDWFITFSDLLQMEKQSFIEDCVACLRDVETVPPEVSMPPPTTTTSMSSMAALLPTKGVDVPASSTVSASLISQVHRLLTNGTTSEEVECGNIWARDLESGDGILGKIPLTSPATLMEITTYLPVKNGARRKRMVAKMSFSTALYEMAEKEIHSQLIKMAQSGSLERKPSQVGMWPFELRPKPAFFENYHCCKKCANDDP